MGWRESPPEKTDSILRFWCAICGEGFDFAGEENLGVRSYPSHHQHKPRLLSGPHPGSAKR
jgi:hypothetical protein